MARLADFDFKTFIAKSLSEIFEQMLGLRVEPTTVVTKSDLLSIDMMSTISFSGHLVGSVRFQVGEKMALIITAAMLGVDASKIQNMEDTYDVVREIVNIIGGNLNSALSKAGFRCKLTVPSVEVDGNFGVKPINTPRHERFAFRHDKHTMFIEIFASPARAKKAARA